MQVNDNRAKKSAGITGDEVRQGGLYEIVSHDSGPNNVYIADDEGGLTRLRDGFRLRVQRPPERPTLRYGRSPLEEAFASPPRPAPVLYRPLKAVLNVES